MSSSAPSGGLISAGPLRRLGALTYDALLMIAIQIVATVPFLPFLDGRVLVAREVGALAYLYHAWQLSIVVGFFGVFWTHRGQTLGMQAWRLRMRTLDGALPTWRDALRRLLFAAIPWLPAFATLTLADYLQPREFLLWTGVGLLTLGFVNYLVAWFDSDRRSWHDRFLRTRVVKER